MSISWEFLEKGELDEVCIADDLRQQDASFNEFIEATYKKACKQHIAKSTIIVTNANRFVEGYNFENSRRTL